MGTRRTTPSKPRRRRTNLLEFFETPPGFTRYLDRNLRMDGRIYCPTVGEGAIVRALQEQNVYTKEFVTNDIDPARRADFHLDATLPEAWWFGDRTLEGTGFLNPMWLGPTPDWVVDNPPFSAAHAILANGICVVRMGIVLHLRVSFPEPTLEREPFLVEHPPDAMFYLPRYSFSVSPKTGKRSTDATTTAWCIWLTDEVREKLDDHTDDGSPVTYPFYSLRRILVAPRSVADEGWNDHRGSEGADTGVRPAE